MLETQVLSEVATGCVGAVAELAGERCLQRLVHLAVRSQAATVRETFFTHLALQKVVQFHEEL